MADTGYFLLSLSILVPSGIGLARLRHLRDAYGPLLLLLGIGVAVEVVSFCFFKEDNAVPENVYFLLEALLYCALFRRWGHVLRSQPAYFVVIGGLVGIWVLDNFVLNAITDFNPLFQVAYSLCLVFFAVDEMNWLIVNEHGHIVSNARFIICISILLYFAYKAAAEVFYYYAEDLDVRDHIFAVEAVLNVAFNMLLSIALLCVPRKIDFISRS